MSEETALLLDAACRWVTLPAETLLIVETGRMPLEARVLRLLAALRRAQQRGEARTLVTVFPSPPHPLREGWAEPAAFRRRLRQLAEGSPGLQWLEAAPSRWLLLRSAVSWRTPGAGLAEARAQLLSQLRLDPRTAGLPAELVLERLLLALLDAPVDAALGVRTLDRESLSRVLDGGTSALLRWARREHPRRLALRLQSLPEATQHALQGEQPPRFRALPEPTSAAPSDLLRAESCVVPFLGAWTPLEALLRWCADPAPQATCFLVGPPGAGKRRLATLLEEVLWACGWRESRRLVIADQHTVPPEGLASDVALRLLRLVEAPPRPLPPDAVVVYLSPVLPADRAAHLRLAASALAAATQREVPWILPIPDLDGLCWPLDLQMAALAALDNRGAVDPARAMVEQERRAWQAAGLDPLAHAESLALDLLAGQASAAASALPEAMQVALVEELLTRCSEVLDTAAPEPALRLLDRLAERRPLARAWLRAVLEADLEARVPLALAIAAERAGSARERPLGGVLAELGVVLEVGEGGLPLRMVTVHYSRQQLTDQEALLPAPPPEPVALAMGAEATPSRPHLRHSRTAGSPTASEGSLAERVWAILQPRLDVVMPHQIRALELLDQDHRGSPRETLARQRVELLVEHVARHPEAAPHLEAALDDLGVLLCAGQLQPDDEPVTAAALSPEERQQARAAARHLQDAAALRSRQDGVAAASAFAEATRLLRGLSERHPALIASDLLHATLEMAALGRALGRPREASETLQALLEPLEALHERYPPHWPRRSTLLGNLALLHLVAGRPQEAQKHARRALEVCPSPRAAGDESARLERLLALHTIHLTGPEQVGPADEALAELEALAEHSPALFLPCLATALDRAARRRRARGDLPGALQCTLAATQAVKGLAALDATLYAPFEGLSLHNLGARLREAGAREVAVDVSLDAAEAYRRQARLSGETFLPDLAMTLCNLGAMLAGVARSSQALALTRKAIGVCWGGTPVEALEQMPRIRRLLIDPLPELGAPSSALLVRGRLREGATRRHPYFMWHLSLLAAAALAPGEGEDEAGMSEQLVRLWRFEETPAELLRPGLGAALHNLGVVLGAGGQPGAGREALAGAAAVWRRLAADRPGVFAVPLAMTLCDLSALCGLDNDPSGAEAASAEAVRLLRAVGPDAPLELGQALLNHSAALLSLGQAPRAAAQAAEAVVLAGADAPTLRAAALHNLALASLARGELQAALEACQAAVQADPGDEPSRSWLLQALHRRLQHAPA